MIAAQLHFPFFGFYNLSNRIVKIKTDFFFDNTFHVYGHFAHAQSRLNGR